MIDYRAEAIDVVYIVGKNTLFCKNIVTGKLLRPRIPIVGHSDLIIEILQSKAVLHCNQAQNTAKYSGGRPELRSNFISNQTTILDKYYTLVNRSRAVL